MANSEQKLSTSARKSPQPSYWSSTHEEDLSDPFVRPHSFSDITPRRSPTENGVMGPMSSSAGYLDMYDSINEARNSIEAQKTTNNYLFGFKKWKSRLTLDDEQDAVNELYDDVNKTKPVTVSTIRLSNLLYVLVFGWWISLIYLLVGVLLMITIVGKAYRPFCWMLAKYFLWPFGKFVHQIHFHQSPSMYMTMNKSHLNGAIPSEGATSTTKETTSLLTGTWSGSEHVTHEEITCGRDYWTKPGTVAWLILGCPVLLLAHGITIFISWMLVVTIPITKVNVKTIQKILFLHPEEVQIGDSGTMNLYSSIHHSEIIMYTQQSVNFRYYKYTIDGMNIVLVNLLLFVVITLILGYADKKHEYTSGLVKCVLSLLAIVPLTYYIGMGIACIAAQSILAVGAILNATFGSAVEIILYVIFLANGLENSNNCFVELVKSAMAGTLLATMMFIPGLSMVAGGLKYQTQKFNPQSAGVSASLLFVSVAGIFAPTIFSKVYGTLQCKDCQDYSTNSTTTNGTHVGLQCSQCVHSLFGINGDTKLYDSHIKPLVYACAIMLPISYIIGLVFTLKTHKDLLYGTNNEEQSHAHHGEAQWSILKSAVIMLIGAVLISLCAEVATENIQPLLQVSGISEYFIGVTLLAIVPDLPEVVNGVLFALQNNVALGLEIGSSAAVQVCLVQIPALVLIDLIYPFGFYLVFNDIHFWAVIFSVIVMNYTIQDGKSNYFQGWILLGIYFVILAMYFFTPVPPDVKCS